MNDTTTKQHTQAAPAASSAGELAVLSPPRLPWHPAIEERFGIDRAGWKALTEAVWPLAKSADSVALALSYCRARNLDPFKKVVHIVPMWDNVRRQMVETVWPGIAEIRTTAFRTGQYAGHDPATYGPDKTAVVGAVEITYPEWCQITVYRLLQNTRVAFPGPRVYWLESYATKAKDDLSPNSMWTKRPHGQIEKCAEAAALRAAFPEEIGNEYVAEEMEGRTIDGSAMPTVPPGPRPSRAQFEKAEPEDPAETYPVADEVGEPYVGCTSPDQWGQEVLAATGPTLEGRFTDKALHILKNNRESADLLMPQMVEGLMAKLQARYAAADECGPSTPDQKPAATPVPAAGAAPATEPPPVRPGAASPSTGHPAPVEPAGADSPPSPGTTPAGPPSAAIPGTAAAAKAPPKYDQAAKRPDPVPEPTVGKTASEDLRQVEMPISERTGKPDGARYLVMMQTEMVEAASAPEHIDLIMKREGYLGPRKYVPGSNLARVMAGTSNSIELFASRRKAALTAPTAAE